MLRVTAVLSPGSACRVLFAAHHGENEHGVGPGVGRVAMMFGFIAAVNLAGWGIFVWYVMPHHVDHRGVGGGLGVGLGVAVTAWFLGFRHALDADHISPSAGPSPGRSARSTTTWSSPGCPSARRSS